MWRVRVQTWDSTEASIGLKRVLVPFALCIRSRGHKLTAGANKMPITTTLRRFPLKFLDPALEQEWIVFSATSSRRFDINAAFCAVYLFAAFINWGANGSINIPDIPGTVAATLSLLICLLMPRFRIYHIAFATLTMMACLGSLLLNTLNNVVSNQGVVLTAMMTVLIYTMSAGYQGNSTTCMIIFAVFIIASGVTMSLVCPEYYSGLNGFYISLSFIKVILTGQLSVYAEDFNRRETYILTRHISGRKQLPSTACAELYDLLPLYFSERNLGSGEHIFPIPPHAKNQEIPLLQRMYRVLKSWIYLKFESAELEQQYLRHNLRTTLELHFLTTLINIFGALATVLFEELVGSTVSEFPESPFANWINNGSLIFFSVCLVLPNLLLVFKSVRDSPMRCQFIILATGVSNILGWQGRYAIFLWLRGTSQLNFHRTLNQVAVAVFAAGPQSGLISYFYIAMFVFVITSQVAILLTLNHIPGASRYVLTSILEACLSTAVLGFINEFESRKLFLLRTWSESFIDASRGARTISRIATRASSANSGQSSTSFGSRVSAGSKAFGLPNPSLIAHHRRTLIDESLSAGGSTSRRSSVMSLADWNITSIITPSLHLDDTDGAGGQSPAEHEPAEHEPAEHEPAEHEPAEHEPC
ncbi:uncharacterized protein BJ171DRAFT_220454 [Polychytrium aggregatum]|uniref:uncharacterized protein n=1 Tax=Polychytrium aggregatum TaxID=110093 RepID=UPI0022FE1599|nr:uncharacterized protein BJ171DRAFT_220454 [Polychytrium aggregatum]KAI9197433.1 hypothetical protein BJ171DRAFT_220454 [Polychytrium aggregatum]